VTINFEGAINFLDESLKELFFEVVMNFSFKAIGGLEFRDSL